MGKRDKTKHQPRKKSVAATRSIHHVDVKAVNVNFFTPPEPISTIGSGSNDNQPLRVNGQLPQSLFDVILSRDPAQIIVAEFEDIHLGNTLQQAHLKIHIPLQTKRANIGVQNGQNTLLFHSFEKANVGFGGGGLNQRNGAKVIQSQLSRINRRKLVPNQRNIRRVVSIKTKLRLAGQIQSDHGKSRILPRTLNQKVRI